jgi:hypothetical protein
MKRSHQDLAVAVRGHAFPADFGPPGCHVPECLPGLVGHDCAILVV